MIRGHQLTGHWLRERPAVCLISWGRCIGCGDQVKESLVSFHLSRPETVCFGIGRLGPDSGVDAWTKGLDFSTCSVSLLCGLLPALLHHVGSLHECVSRIYQFLSCFECLISFFDRLVLLHYYLLELFRHLRRFFFGVRQLIRQAVLGLDCGHHLTLQCLYCRQ
jgi:hypothetical protein